MIKTVLVFATLLFLGFNIAGTVFASHSNVLGVSDRISSEDLPVNQGPGFLLPTSPLYFVDLLRDKVMVMLTSYDKTAEAKLHLKIAGERISEMNIALDGNAENTGSLDVALTNMSEHITQAASALRAAKNKGSNVEQLASEMNTSINEQKKALVILQAKTNEEGKLKIAARLPVIRDAEISIEDEMSSGQLANEIMQELQIALDQANQEADSAYEKAMALSEELNKNEQVVLGVQAASENDEDEKDSESASE